MNRVEDRFFRDDTIVAISTPVGKNGIGIVRLSGKKALKIADKVFITSNGLCPSKFPSHTIHYGWIVENVKCKMQNVKLNKTSIKNRDVIDEVLLTVMRAPRTYTREDIVEINCHSGIVILKRILDLLLKSGARLAQPGEFTKRAYLSGRIDLAQAEAVLDVVNAQTQPALHAALGQLRGRFSQKVASLRENILEILTHLEAAIDFADQDIATESPGMLLRRMEKVTRTLNELLDSAEQGAILREGVSCVICGKPNVGKSSLLNALLRRERAIVTPLPGTTRDVLEETVDVSGIPLRLIDTAGIAPGRDLAEKEAVRHSRRCLKTANLALLVLDGSLPLSAEDAAVAAELENKPVLVVLNKRDLPAKVNLEEAAQVRPGSKVLPVSALRGKGLSGLEREMVNCIWQGKVASDAEVLVTNRRHAAALRQAQQLMTQAIYAVKQKRSPELVTLEIKEVDAALGEITGAVRGEAVLERIFTQFCIGK